MTILWWSLGVLAFATFVIVAIRLRRAGKLGPRGYPVAERPEKPGAPGARPDLSEFPCGHAGGPGLEMITLAGAAGTQDRKICRACFEKYLEKYGTSCAACGGRIVPGEPVGQAWQGAKFPHTHLTNQCCDSGGLYCGRWGQGRLITLHELDPEQFPPGTTTVMAHAFKTGKPVFMNID